MMSRRRRPFMQEKEPVVGQDSYERPGTTLHFLGNRIERVRYEYETLAKEEALGGISSLERRGRARFLKESVGLVRDQTLGFASNRGVRGELKEIYEQIDSRSRRIQSRRPHAARNYWLRKTISAAEEWLEEHRLLIDVEAAPYNFTEDLWEAMESEARVNYLRAHPPVPESPADTERVDELLAELEEEPGNDDGPDSNEELLDEEMDEEDEDDA